jgi:uncharacterized protein YdiU (UPF0061 family)
MSDIPALPTTAGWRLEHTYSRLPTLFHAAVAPTPAARPRTVLLNRDLARELGLDPEVLAREEYAAVFTGNRLPEGAAPLAQAYAGHQFGHFARLGDGRAILLGEQVGPDGRRHDIQLKGAGPTPYSRRGDGRAALGPMLREHLVGEAMHALGIPTTRALAVAATGEPVLRAAPLHGAVLVRVAASHIRVGTFEWAAAAGGPEAVRALADHAIARHYPGLVGAGRPYRAFLDAVIGRQASLVAGWQLVGFVHGVMNTDNMAVSGETIDYGPCAFMESYDPATVFSSIDHGGRYAYGRQPAIAQWNLARLAEALLPLLDDDEARAVDLANESLAAFPELHQGHWLRGMRAKLGLVGEHPDDGALAEDFLAILRRGRMDYTNAFRDLTAGRLEASPSDDAALGDWLVRWRRRAMPEMRKSEDSRALMRRMNPAFIPRNHKVEEALFAAAEHGDLGPYSELLGIVTRPFDHDRDLPCHGKPAPADAGPYRTFCGT